MSSFSASDRVREHRYDVVVDWTGARGGPTTTYAAYSRDHEIAIAGKPVLICSADPLFRGTAGAHNPEELLVAALSSCHMLAYLALCAREGIAVAAYRDAATGSMNERGGAGRFTNVTLHPLVTLVYAGPDHDARTERAIALHQNAHAECFIANSVNFPVLCIPEIVSQAKFSGSGC